MADSISPTLERCILSLHECGAVKFGNFTLKSGIQSPFYLDLRVIISFPSLLDEVANLMWIARSKDLSFDRICGVPYTALPIASILSIKQNIPMIIRRKEAKGHGTKKILEGFFKEGDECLILEDIIVSGSSVVETVEVLKKEKIKVSETIVFVDREQGGRQNLTERGIKVTPVITITKMVDILRKHSKISEEEGKGILKFISQSHVAIPLASIACERDSREKLSLDARAAIATHPLLKKVFATMQEKQSNLCVAVDVTKASDLIRLADLVGPHVCILKTHIDILDDFKPEVIEELRRLSKKHNFLLFEDRKFSDIGSTVKSQFCGSIYNVSSWADIVSIHGLPGEGVIQGLKMGAEKEKQGCVIVAQMSSEGNLCTENYTAGCLSISKKHSDFVVGFVAQNNISSDPKVIIMTPGVHLETTGDKLGQQYKTPKTAVEGGADVVIVGRGITHADDPKSACILYKEAAFSALKERISN